MCCLPFIEGLLITQWADSVLAVKGGSLMDMS